MSWLTQSDDLKRGAAAGLVAGAAMIAAMGIDLRLTGQRTNELRLLAGVVPGGRRAWPLVGSIMHFANSAALGTLFAWVHHGLPGPAWARGLLFAEVENLALWPVLIVLDRVHPGIKRGEIESFNRPSAFVVEVIRHAVYGAVLGAVYQRLGTRDRSAPFV